MSRICVLLLFTLMLSPASSDTVVILSRRQIATGKKLYEGKCAKCHKLREPTDYSTEEWRLWFGKMSRKAKLKPAQENLVARYLDTYRSEKSSTNNVPAVSREPKVPPTVGHPPASMTNNLSGRQKPG